MREKARASAHNQNIRINEIRASICVNNNKARGGCVMTSCGNEISYHRLNLVPASAAGGVKAAGDGGGE